MILFSRYVLIATILLVARCVQIMPVRAGGLPTDHGNVPGVTGFFWNAANHEVPFRSLTNELHSDDQAQLVYPRSDFAFALSQSLYYDAACDCYTLTVSMRASRALQIVHFWRAPRGFYRTANGAYLELEDFDSLKAVTALDGTRFLFAQVGDGEWHCVSIHDSLGSYLLIDYRADGLIERLRDSLSRTAIPTYDESRMILLTQTWTAFSGQQMQTTLVTGLSRK